MGNLQYILVEFGAKVILSAIIAISVFLDLELRTSRTIDASFIALFRLLLLQGSSKLTLLGWWSLGGLIIVVGSGVEWRGSLAATLGTSGTLSLTGSGFLSWGSCSSFVTTGSFLGVLAKLLVMLT